MPFITHLSTKCCGFSNTRQNQRQHKEILLVNSGARTLRKLLFTGDWRRPKWQVIYQLVPLGWQGGGAGASLRELQMTPHGKGRLQASRGTGWDRLHNRPGGPPPAAGVPVERASEAPWRSRPSAKAPAPPPASAGPLPTAPHRPAPPRKSKTRWRSHCDALCSFLSENNIGGVIYFPWLLLQFGSEGEKGALEKRNSLWKKASHKMRDNNLIFLAH